MRKALRISVVMLLSAASAFAQQNNTQTNSPGVPGACGYPNAQSNARTGPANPAPQDGNGTLGVIYDDQKCGLDYTHASQRIGQRFSPVGVPQPAPFVISGIPACAVIEKAYLWAEGSGNGAAQTATIAGPSGTQNFPMTIVGQGPDKCWSYAGSYTYRADVTSVVSGNGTYNVSGLLTNPPTSGNDMDGATLIVVWSDPSQAWAGRLVIADGAIVINGGSTTYNMPISPAVCGATTNARAFFGVGDIQMNPTSWSANSTPVPLSFNWWNFHEVSTTVLPAAGNAPYSVASSGDCYNLCISGLYFRTVTCTTCPTSTAMTVTATSTGATCSQCNGTATVTNVTGATGPFTYSWAPTGGNAATATGLCAGTYSVTVTSANGCQVTTQTVTVASTGGAITLANAPVSNVTCNGGSDGSATTTASGGSSPFTFSWSPSATNTTSGNSNTATGLIAGTYVVTATDANGCTGQQTVTITQPAAITTTATSTPVTCPADSTGSVSVTASGGAGSYTYLWNPSGGTGSTESGLPAGSYTVTVTDANGCTTTQTVAITSPSSLASTITATNVSCFGGTDGVAVVSTTGGSPGYTHVWSPAGGTNDTASGLIAGAYTVVTTDANGCTNTQSVTITEPPVLTTSVTSTPVICTSQGTATATPSGGTGSYTYAWAPSGGSSATESNLAAGTYTVTVTDANGCTTSQSVTVTQVATMQVSASSTDATCFASSNGSGTVTPTGGSAPYTYQWSPSGGTNATATGLAAGTYTVLITDALGCTATQTVIISQPTQITGSSGGTAPTCNGSLNGSAFVTASGGTGSFTYQWSPSGGSSANATGLGAGTYSVVVTDANGCTFTQSVILTQPPAIAATGTGNQVCPGSTANIFVSASGGASPYTYTWSNGPTTATQSLVASTATAGVYTVTVTDANGCTQTATAALSLLPTPTAAYTTDATNGVVVLTGGTGTICYTDQSTGATSWQWDFNGQGTSNLQSPCFAVTSANAGTFCAELTVQNSNGCFDTTLACVEVGQHSYSIPNVFTPNGDGTNDQWIITNEGMTRLHCTIYDRWGVLIYEWDGTTGNWDGQTTSGKEAVDGVYYFTAQLTDFTGTNYEEHGFFQLIR